jgi:ATP-binding cassette subfamily B protein
MTAPAPSTNLSRTSAPPPERVPLTDAVTRIRGLSALLPFLRPYHGRLVLAGVFLLLAVACMLALPGVLKTLIDGGFNADPDERVLALREHFFSLFLVGSALGFFTALRMYVITWLGERITADVRTAVYAHVLRQSPAFFEITQTGEVLSRLTTDTTLVQTVLAGSLSMGLRNAAMAVGAVVMLVVHNARVMAPTLAVVLLIVLPAVYLGRRVRALSRSSQDRVADASAVAAEVLNAMPVVQSYVQEGREAGRFAVASERAFRTAMRRTRVRAVMMVVMTTAMISALLWSLYRGTEAVLRGDMTAGHLWQTVGYAFMLVSSVATLAEVYGELLRAAGANERLMELLAARSPIVEPTTPRVLPRAAAGSSVELRDVSFRYPSRPQHAALSSVSLEVRPGETVALVGPSGAGKSTVLQLLLRFHDVSAGRVLIDGVDVAECALGELRGRIGIVPQESVVFSASVFENIRYGKPEASEVEVVAAAQAAFADDFIRALPEGYATHLGERGVRLSGGQRQRISIARALLKNPPLLLLDEATSALDAESERAVQAALASAMRGRTTLVIAHRLATVQRADRIVVMEAGQIVDVGTHAQLLARGGLYARLAALQFEV